MRKSSTSLISIFLLISVISAQDNLYNLALVSQARGAACLDGSAPGIYIHEGKGANKNNYLLYFEGGGFCGEPTLAATIESCYKRSLTDLGSSKKYPKTFDAKGMGALSPYPEQNPLFHDWTKVGVKYCDGHEYVGHRQTPIDYKNSKLYFRGSRNVKEIFNYMSQKYDFYNGGKIVIGGGSAGGICSFEWSNYLVSNTKKATIYATPDSGFFITDYTSPLFNTKILRSYAEPLMSLVYNETQTPQPILQCIQNSPSFDIVDCMNSANYVKYMTAHLFVIESPYDQWSIANILGTRCYSNRDAPYSIQNCNDTVRAAIEGYRLKSIEYLKSMRQAKKNVGIWGPACVQHGFQHQSRSYNNQKFLVNGTTLMEALTKFLENPEQAPWLLDERPWPENTGCNGLSSNLREQ